MTDLHPHAPTPYLPCLSVSILVNMQSLSLLVLVGALAGVSGSDSGLFNWMTLGDWGGASISAQDKQNVYAVATQMATTASASDPAFIVNTGDN